MTEPADEFVPREADGSVVVDLNLAGDDGEETLQYDDDDPNLCAVFSASDVGKKALKKIADTVIRRFDSSFQSSQERREKVSDNLRLLFGNLPDKTWPWQGCANAHIPMALENTVLLSFRVEDEVFGDWSNVFGVMPVGPADEEVAQDLTLHGNWQIREKITDFQQQMSRSVVAFCYIGDVTVHSWWNSVTKLNCHEYLTPDEFITPYAYSTCKPDYSDLPFYTKVFKKYRHELQQLEDEYFEVDRLLDGKPPTYDDEPDETMREARAEVEGIEEDDEAESAPYKLLWHEGWLELPNKDRDCWCQVIMDYKSRAILKLTILEEVNWQDRLRFEQQTAELQQFRMAQGMRNQALQQYQQAQAAALGNIGQHQGVVNEMAQAGVSPEGLTFAQSGVEQKKAVAGPALAQMAAQIPPEPPPPVWMSDPNDPLEQPKPARRDPVYMFAHGKCVEPLLGNLGLGFGDTLADLNRAVNTVTSQFIDQQTLANTKTFITTENVEFDSPLELIPGKLNKVTGVPPGQLEGNMMPLEFGDPNPSLVTMAEQWKQDARAAAQAPAVLGGASGKSGETAHGLEARIEQATKQISVAARHFCILLKQVLKNNAKLNSIYLDDAEIATVVSEKTGQPQTVQASKDMYRRDYRVEISADLRFASQAQRIAEADELVGLVGSMPPLQGNLAYQYYTLVKSLQARGRTDVIPYLGKPPPVPAVFGMPSFPPPAPTNMPGAPQGAPPPEMPPGQPPGPSGRGNQRVPH